MTAGNTFGRRASPSGSAGAGGKRAAPSTEVEEVSPSFGDPLPRVIAYAAGVFGLLGAVAVAMWLYWPAVQFVHPVARLGPEPLVSGAASPSDAGRMAPAVAAGPAPAAPVAAAANAAVPDEQRSAALEFFGFFHLNTRVRSAYCAKAGIEMEPFAARFRQSQSQPYARASAVAAAAGLTEEQIFATSRAELEGLIGPDMEKIGQQMGMGGSGACQLMVQFVDAIVPGIDFAKVMPEAHRTLMGG